MAIEYLGLSEINGPLVVLEGVKNASYEEIVEFHMDDGTQKTLTPGTSYVIPPGHDAWVEGDERFVGIEVMSAEQYAKPS